MRKGATHLKNVMIEITPSALQQKNNHKTLDQQHLCSQKRIKTIKNKKSAWKSIQAPLLLW
jgi:hypothetical protein